MKIGDIFYAVENGACDFSFFSPRFLAVLHLYKRYDESKRDMDIKI